MDKLIMDRLINYYYTKKYIYPNDFPELSMENFYELTKIFTHEINDKHNIINNIIEKLIKSENIINVKDFPELNFQQLTKLINIYSSELIKTFYYKNKKFYLI